MKALLRLAKRATYADYLAAQQNSDTRLSEGDDEGDKRTDFQSLASLQAYVLVAQDERRVIVSRRDDTGAWPRQPETYQNGDRIDLPTLGSAMAMAEIYDGILDTSGRSLLR